MANPRNYIKAEQIVAAFIGALTRDTRYPMLFTLYNGRGFVGAKDDTVTWKLPSIATSKEYEFRTRTAEIPWDQIARTSVSVTLDTHLTSLLPLTDEEVLLDLTSYMTEIGGPQADAIARRAERKIRTALEAAPFVRTDLDADTADDALDYALAVKAVLDLQGTPTNGRKLLVGSNVYAWLVRHDAFVKYDTAQALTAFRRGLVGTIAGFDVVDGGTMVGADEIYAVHASALVIANLAPLVPQGASWGGRMARDGWSLRVVRDFDIRMGQDASLLNTFMGVSSVNDEYTRDADGEPVFDVNGNLTMTGKNARGAKGVFNRPPAA